MTSAARLLTSIAATALLAGWSGAAGAQPAMRVLGHIAVGGEGGWDYATVDPVHRKLYVTRGASVMALDLDTHVPTLKLVAATGAHIALPVNGGAELVVTNGQTQTATIVDAITGALRATIPTGPKPDAAVFEPATGLVFVMGNKTGEMTLLDPKTGAAAGMIQVGGALEFAAADGRGRVFVNVEDKGELVAVDAKSRAVVGRYKLDGCEEPSGLAYDAGKRLLLSACGNGVAKVVSAADGRVVATLKIGPHPDAALYDDVRRVAYVPAGGGEGTLAVIDLDGSAGPRVLQTVATAKGARLGGVDPKTGHVYLPVAKYRTPATAGGRPPMVPGSFEILEVGY